MSSEELRNLIASGETDRLEFHAVPSPQIGQHVAAFASSSGGVVLLGVDDGGDVIGVAPSEAVREQAEAWIGAVVYPSPKVEIARLAVDEHEIIAIVVHRGREPVYFYRNTAYRRIRAASLRMSAPEIAARYGAAPS